MTARELAFHSMPRHLFEALAAGRGGPEAMRALMAAQRSKHLMLLRGTLQAARAADDEQARRLARHSHEVLVAAERRNPAAVAQTVCYPAVGAWAMRALRGEAGRAAAGIARLSTVAAAAAVRAGLDVEVPVLSDAGVVCLPALGVGYARADTVVVRSFQGRAEIGWAGGRVDVPVGAQQDLPGWHSLRRVHLEDFELVLDDLDPFRMPAVTGLAPRLNARDVDEWRRILRAGYQLLAATQSVAATEVALAVTAIVPLASSPHGQLSSSSPETFGAMAMSKPDDQYACAATFAHEIQHLKLHALADIARLTLPDDGRRYYAPWRADPRPVAGLLQGAYAYLGVTEFWLAQRRQAKGVDRVRADSEFALWRAGTTRVINTLLSSGRLTPVGLDFVQGMSKAIGAWKDEPVSARARAIALEKSRHHLTRWERDNGPVPT
jgi:HEXXH motif-containing protein